MQFVVHTDTGILSDVFIFTQVDGDLQLTLTQPSP
jgi:hypothetical protein